MGCEDEAQALNLPSRSPTHERRTTQQPMQPLRAGAPAPTLRTQVSTHRHRIVIVGGGAGGLELATRLGDRMKRVVDVTLIDRNRTHVWKPKLHEIAAGSMDLAAHEVDYLAQAHWHGFRYRIGEMIGLDRARREVHVAASFDEEGREVTPQRAFGYDTLVIAVGSESNDFGTPGVEQHAMKLETQARREALPRAHGQRLHPRACARRGAAPRATQGRDHRRRRDRRRAGRRAAPHDTRGRGLRARSHRSRQGPQGHAGRSGRPRAAGAACAAVASDAGVAGPLRRAGAYRTPASPRCCATAFAWPTGSCCRPSWSCGRPA